MNSSLDAEFLAQVTGGLNCSPFEAQAILEVVKEIYLPWLQSPPTLKQPGKLSLLAVAAYEPAGRAVALCRKTLVCLTLHRGPEDDRLLARGAATFRKTRIPDLCHEALSQGALLTCEDLAYRVFFVSTRTVSRDLRTLREENPTLALPLKRTYSTVKRESSTGTVGQHEISTLVASP